MEGRQDQFTSCPRCVSASLIQLADILQGPVVQCPYKALLSVINDVGVSAAKLKS